MRTVAITTSDPPIELRTLGYEVAIIGDLIVIHCPVCDARCHTTQALWKDATFYHEDNCLLFLAQATVGRVKES
jgi:hypothetical protein